MIFGILNLFVELVSQEARRLFPLSTWASRPDPATHLWGLIWITDLNALFRSSGTRWVPVSGRLVLRNVNTDITSGATTAETALDTYTPPAGLFDQDGMITLEVRASSSANTNQKRLRLRLGGTTAIDGDEMGLVSMTSATGIAAFYTFGIVCRGGVASQLGLGSGANGQTGIAYRTASQNLALAVPFYLTVQKDTAGDSVVVKSVRWVYEKGATL